MIDKIKAFGNSHCIIAWNFNLCFEQPLDTFSYQYK